MHSFIINPKIYSPMQPVVFRIIDIGFIIDIGKCAAVPQEIRREVVDINSLLLKLFGNCEYLLPYFGRYAPFGDKLRDVFALDIFLGKPFAIFINGY